MTATHIPATGVRSSTIPAPPTRLHTDNYIRPQWIGAVVHSSPSGTAGTQTAAEPPVRDPLQLRVYPGPGGQTGRPSGAPGRILQVLHHDPAGAPLRDMPPLLGGAGGRLAAPGSGDQGGIGLSRWVLRHERLDSAENNAWKHAMFASLWVGTASNLWFRYSAETGTLFRGESRSLNCFSSDAAEINRTHL